MIVKIYQRFEDKWFRINEKIRFLLVGSFNTAMSFILYYAFLYFTSGKEQLALFLMNLVNINLSITTMRYYVFHSHGNFWKEYTKAFSSYIVLYFVNVGLLAFFVSIIDLQENLSVASPLQNIPNLDKAISQLCCIIIMTFITFFIHKYFSFRQQKNKATE